MHEQQPLRARVRRKPAVGVFWFSSGSSALLELAQAAAPEAIVLDAQHGLWDRLAIENAFTAALRDTPILVRTMDHSKGAISSALDAGAHGVIVPLIESAAQAAEAVEGARYPPQGKRSAGGVRPLSSDFVAYYQSANATTFVAVMIETLAGFEQAQAIAGVPGIDMIFIGTGDLALSLGTFPKADPRHEEICQSILATCRTAGVACGIFTQNAEAAARRAAQGYDLVVVANDGDIIGRGFRDAQEFFAKAVGNKDATDEGTVAVSAKVATGPKASRAPKGKSARRQGGSSKPPQR